jgi:small subunit ribosomal protein S2
MPSSVTVKALLETGVHFGHRTTKWNPKMKPYIYTERNGIHIIDLQQTIVNLNQFYDMIRDMVQAGGTILFVGTKRQAQEAVASEADRCGMPYVNTRWLGGTLTNWRTIRDRLETFKKLEKRREAGEFEMLSKKEGLILGRKIEKMQERLGGIRNMKKLPDLLIVVDTRREATAVKEANTLKIPVMALADTNSDPDTIDYIIPANDDAVRAVKLLLGALADAAIEGAQLRNAAAADTSATSAADAEFFDKYADEEDDANLMGTSTLARVNNARLFDDTDTEE